MTDRDSDITELLLARDEDGIAYLRGRHGRLGMQIAYNILHDEGDAEECLSDALHALWEQVPPNTPDPLLPYFLRIVRNTALKRRRAMTAQKREGGVLLSPEDWDTVAELDLTAVREEDSARIREALNGFLGGLRREDRILFVRRYWFEDDPARIAEVLGITENHARVRLTRCKKKLRAYLEKEGITI